MKFGPVPVGDAVGAILAHSFRHSGGTIRKGTRLDDDTVEKLRADGVQDVVVARLEADDLHEDDAAHRLALALKGTGLRVEPPFTGRANLFAERAGVFVVNASVIDSINRIDPGITVATLPEFASVEASQMVATVKIIPYSVPEAALNAAVDAAKQPLGVTAFQAKKVGLVATTLPSLKASVIDKTARLLEERLTRAGASLFAERRVAHEPEAVAIAAGNLASTGADLIVIFGASATGDVADVVPAGLVRAGGQVVHFGMPVDPGNLLLLGELNGKPVIGAPGCARSPKENGFDWVLYRLLAGLDVTPDDLTGFGVGGLLMEIVSRPQPREADPEPHAGEQSPKIAALILAAGRSSRMGGPNKLVATINGVPIVRRVAGAALASAAHSVTVVTGNRPEDVANALEGLPVARVHNPDFAEGLSTSLRAGLDSLPDDIDGALVLLADMPSVDERAIDRLIRAFDPETGALVVIPTHDGKRGNPVLWSRRFFKDLMRVEGDQGGRAIIAANPDGVVEVEIGAASAIDVDTPEALVAAGGRLPEPS